MTEYYFTFRENSWVTDPPEEDGGPWSYQGSSDLSVELTGIFKSPPEALMGFSRVRGNDYTTIYGVDDILVGDTAYVLLIRYQDGDTFGSSGYWTIPGIFNSLERAQEAKAMAEQPRDGDHYRDWDGYFASLTEARIVEMVVKP